MELHSRLHRILVFIGCFAVPAIIRTAVSIGYMRARLAFAMRERFLFGFIAHNKSLLAFLECPIPKKSCSCTNQDSLVKVKGINCIIAMGKMKEGVFGVIEVNIPGRGLLRLTTLVLDYNGTLALDGVLLDGVREQIIRLAEALEIYVLTSDTYGSASAQCRTLPVSVHVLKSTDHTQEKADFIAQLGQEQAAAVGNGANDRLMLERAALGITVIGSEGAAAAALMSSDVVVGDIGDALGLLLNPRRLVATLRK